MSGTHLSTVRNSSIRADVTKRFGSREATAVARQQQRILLEMRVGSPSRENISRKPVDQLSRMKTVPLRNHKGDFTFTPFPSKILVVRPTLYERLERDDLRPTDTQLRIIKLGRKSILKYGSPELAVQALQVAERQTVSEKHHMRQRLRRDEPTLRNCLRLIEIAKRVVGYKVSAGQQQIGIRAAAVEMATGIEKQQALSILKRESAWAYMLELGLPFRRHVDVQRELFYRTRDVHPSLCAICEQGLDLNAELSVLVEDFNYHGQQTKAPSEFERRYNLIRAPAFEALVDLSSSRTQFWRLLSPLILDCERSRSSLRRLLAPLKDFEYRLILFSRACDFAGPVLSTILLRRQSLHGTKQQDIFNALHHHLKQTLVSSHNFYRRSLRTLTYTLESAVFHRFKHGSSTAPILTHQQTIRTALDKIQEGMNQISHFYHKDLLLFWIPGINLMSPNELARQDLIARRYWLSCLQFDKEVCSRLQELRRLRYTIKLFRQSTEVREKEARQLRHQARLAIVQLSLLHAAQDRGKIDHNTRLSRGSTCYPRMATRRPSKIDRSHFHREASFEETTDQFKRVQAAAVLAR